MLTEELRRRNNITIEGNLSARQTMVFGHGFGTDQTAWNRVKKAFSDDYRLVLYDNTGAGKSDPSAFSPIKYGSIYSYAEDLIQIAEAMELKNAIMVAHSVSSMVSLIAAVKRPDFFSKMVFIGASPRYLNDGDYTGGFSQQDLNGMYETMRTSYYAWVSGFSAAAMANSERPELGAEFAGTLGAIRPDLALTVAKVIFESDVRSELSRLQKPVLLIQSQRDIAVPQSVAEYLSQKISDSKLVNVNAEGHFPHISAPEEIIAAIHEFLE